MRALVVVIVACASSPRSIAEIADVDDRCPTLPAECLVGFDPFVDHDGCPDPLLVIAFAPGDDAIPSSATRMLADIASDAPKLAEHARIFVHGERAPDEAPGIDLRRALAVVSALRTRGVLADRVVPEHRVGEARVSIECGER